MNCWGKWKSIFVMLVINLAFAMVNILLKKTLDGGLGGLIIVTYRQSISAVLLTPIAFFWERLEKVNIKKKGAIAKVLGAPICISGAVSLILYKGMPLTNQHSESTVQMQNYANTTTFSSAKKSDGWAVGSVFLASGCFLWSSWFLIQAKIGKSYPFQYSSTAILSSFGAIQSAILCFITERHIVMSMWLLKGKLEIFSVVYVGVVGSGLCYVGMSWYVKQKGTLFTAAFTPATLIFVAMLEFSFLHEQIYLGSLVGSVIVITGMYILLWGKSKDQKEMMIKQTQAADQDKKVVQCHKACLLT